MFPLTDFKHNRIAILRNFVNPDDISQTRIELDNLLNNTYPNNKCIRLKPSSKELKQMPTIRKIFQDTQLKNIQNTILENGSKVADIFIHKDYQNEGTNNVYPHFDFSRKLKFYLCVNDMNEENGCFGVVTGKQDIVSQKRNINPRHNIFREGHKLFNGYNIPDTDVTPVIANAGDMIIFDTNCIHKGGTSFQDKKYRIVVRYHIAGKFID